MPSVQIVRLFSNETLWIFLLASSEEPEIRHIYDIAYGVRCLENKGISPDNIRLIIDGDKNTIYGHLKQLVKTSYIISTSDNLQDIVKKSIHKNIVVFVTGHGYFEDGIDAPKPIKPYNLLTSLRSSKHTENIVIYLGQCYAGIFNYIKVAGYPKTIIIGSTNLYPSISCTLEGIPWCANLFLFNLFRWIENPVDIDGDDKFTVMDSFKYAGAETNRYCQRYKGCCLERTIELLEEKKQVNSSLELKALETELYSIQNIHYNTQEPWILNEFPAQSIEF